MHFVGAKVRVSCDQGYQERNGITQATCNSTGDWDPTPVCDMIPTTSSTTVTTAAYTTISTATKIASPTTNTSNNVFLKYVIYSMTRTFPLQLIYSDTYFDK